MRAGGRKPARKRLTGCHVRHCAQSKVYAKDSSLFRLGAQTLVTRSYNFGIAITILVPAHLVHERTKQAVSC